MNADTITSPGAKIEELVHTMVQVRELALELGWDFDQGEFNGPMQADLFDEFGELAPAVRATATELLVAANFGPEPSRKPERVPGLAADTLAVIDFARNRTAMTEVERY